jgi:hypothetical protein
MMKKLIFTLQNNSSGKKLDHLISAKTFWAYWHEAKWCLAFLDVTKSYSGSHIHLVMR